MIHSLLKKYSALAALAAMLLAMFAAPYMIPADPDSMVFRGGTLGALLMLAGFYPVRHALQRHSLRAIIFGCAFALVFSVCLSLGSELTHYQQLLPGMGSLLRRLAVPCMLTPMLGALISYLFACTPVQSKRLRLPYAVYFFIFAACYGLVLLAFYPGVIAYDFEHEIRQYQTGVYEAAHPVFHTLFLGGLYQLGETLFGSMTAGAATYSVVQLLLVAAIYAWVCAFIARRVPWYASLLLAAGFALLPFHGVLAVSTSKDPLFGALCAALCLLLWELGENPSAFLNSRFKIARFVLCCLLLALIRRNGVFAFLPGALALVPLARGCRKQMTGVAALTLTLCLCAPPLLDLAVGAQSAPSSEMMSVPCQQLMRTAARGNITAEEYDEIAPWFSGAIDRYRAHCADPAKGGNFDFARYQENPDEFWDMYFKYAKKYPRIYLEAFLENCAGLWNPDDVSHSNSLAGELYDYVYLITEYMYEPSRYAIKPHSLLPQLKTLLYDFTHHSAQQKTLLLAQLFCPATYSFLLLLSTMLAVYKKQRRLALCGIPLWGVWGSLLFSAGIFIRYAYPLMTAVPLLFALTLFTGNRDCA